MNDLRELGTRIWHELARACTHRSAGWRTPVLATVDAAGLPDARTVVLREADAQAARLVCFTDARSPKVGQLAVQPQALLVFWDATLQWQLRARVQATVHTDGAAAQAAWARVSRSRGALDYLSRLAPGSPLRLDDDAGTSQPDAARAHHFALIEAQVLSLDWLALDAQGEQGTHRRAGFANGRADGPAQWLVP